MAYEAKNFDHLIGLDGFSETLLKNHFTLYQGYVKNTNATQEAIASMLAEGKTVGPEFVSLKQRLGWEWNGMRLHEFYFENLKKGESSPIPTDFENMLAEFKVMAVMRAIGWVIMAWDPIEKQLINVWITEHDTGHLVGCTPLLVLDVFEHAYMTDHGLKRADYIEAFMKAIDWEVVTARFSTAKKIQII
ncbi:MAG: Fe-Mn family superoxide dismutase [Patescibacteria group bacterium]